MADLRGSRVLLTGATGFVGGRLYPALTERGYEVRCASRNPARARDRAPDRAWVRLDVDAPETLAPALEGCAAAYYLVHGMGESGGDGDYEARELAAARTFAEAARAAGVRRIVYLGGVAPAGPASKHLRSRLAVGDALRRGPVPTVELRAGMIVGAGSASWRICRDLAVRLPAMVLPKWLKSRSQPVAIRDVVAALCAALDRVPEAPVVLDVPGPEVLSARQILERIAALQGTRPFVVEVPVVTPRLSTLWIELVSSADRALARELVEGLTSDLLAPDEGIWRHLPEHRRLGFDEAARVAFLEEAHGPLSQRALERLLHAVSRREPGARP